MVKVNELYAGGKFYSPKDEVMGAYVGKITVVSFNSPLMSLGI